MHAGVVVNEGADLNLSAVAHLAKAHYPPPFSAAPGAARGVDWHVRGQVCQLRGGLLSPPLSLPAPVRAAPRNRLEHQLLDLRALVVVVRVEAVVVAVDRFGV